MRAYESERLIESGRKLADEHRGCASNGCRLAGATSTCLIDDMHVALLGGQYPAAACQRAPMQRNGLTIYDDRDITFDIGNTPLCNVGQVALSPTRATPTPSMSVSFDAVII